MSKIQSTDQAARKEDFRTFLELLLPYLRLSDTTTANESVLSSELVVTKSTGGISAGTTYEQGTSIESILRDLLTEVASPSLTNPSVSISVNSSTQMTSGESKNVTITANFNRGRINPAYGTSGYRSGEVIGYSLNGGAEQTSNTFNVTVDEDHKTFVVTARYAEGEQPKDSVGEDYSTPLPAGSVTSNTITFTFVVDTMGSLWSNSVDNETLTEERIDKTVGTKTWENFAACTEESPEVFYVPSDWHVTAIEAYVAFTHDFEDRSDQFDVEENVEYEGKTYTKYTDNRGMDAGARTIRIRWN